LAPKSTKKLEKEVKELKDSVQMLKGDLLDLRRSIDMVFNRQEELNILFNWHGHPEAIRMSGKAMFLQEQYEQFVQQQQAQQQGATPTSEAQTKNESEPEEEEEE
jgi:hypothetical protein